MFYLIERFGWLPAGALSAVFIFLRYALLAGLFFSIFYVIWKHRFLPRKIQRAFPAWSTIRYEIRHSLETAVIFALVGLFIFLLSQKGYARLYFVPDAYGWWYLPVSLLALILIHDTYFYWLHRWMHHPRLFRMLHKVHHQSYNPTPWAALSFHPLEAILEIAIIPVVICVMPVHPVVLLLFATWSLLFNVLGHLGYELFPKGFVEHPIGKWINTSTHHNLHHARSRCNFGLYFNWWDRWMGTNAADYAERFREN